MLRPAPLLEPEQLRPAVACSQGGASPPSAHVDTTHEPLVESRPAVARALSAVPEEACTKSQHAAETFAGFDIEGKVWTDADNLNVRILQLARAAEISGTCALPSLKKVHAFQIRWRPQVVQWIGDVRRRCRCSPPRTALPGRPRADSSPFPRRSFLAGLLRV